MAQLKKLMTIAVFILIPVCAYSSQFSKISDYKIKYKEKVEAVNAFGKKVEREETKLTDKSIKKILGPNAIKYFKGYSYEDDEGMMAVQNQSLKNMGKHKDLTSITVTAELALESFGINDYLNLFSKCYESFGLNCDNDKKECSIYKNADHGYFCTDKGSLRKDIDEFNRSSSVGFGFVQIEASILSAVIKGEKVQPFMFLETSYINDLNEKVYNDYVTFRGVFKDIPIKVSGIFHKNNRSHELESEKQIIDYAATIKSNNAIKAQKREEAKKRKEKEEREEADASDFFKNMILDSNAVSFPMPQVNLQRDILPNTISQDGDTVFIGVRIIYDPDDISAKRESNCGLYGGALEELRYELINYSTTCNTDPFYTEVKKKMAVCFDKNFNNLGDSNRSERISARSSLVNPIYNVMCSK